MYGPCECVTIQAMTARRLSRLAGMLSALVLLVSSSLLTAAALWSPGHHWLACFSFLPLFAAVRWLHPAKAAFAGGLWGACLYFFSTSVLTPAFECVVPAIGPSTWLLALLIVIPAAYLGLAARPARAVGFKLLTLALGWTLIEVVVFSTHPNSFEPRAGPVPTWSVAQAMIQQQDLPTNLHQGLLTSSQSEGSHPHWLARLLGYICTAFLVACANASLVGILTRAHLSFPPCRSTVGSPNVGAWLPSQVILANQSWTLRRAYPRAPPSPAAPARWNPVGNAHGTVVTNRRRDVAWAHSLDLSIGGQRSRSWARMPVERL